jgi:uncharacterized phage protein (TIGR01671 family)
MREILFRGKSVKTGKWEMGHLTSFDGCYVAMIRPLACMAEHQVVVETVGQYAGLKDRNGVRIFEGDVVKTVDVPTPALWEVVFYLRVDRLESYFNDGTQTAAFSLKKITAAEEERPYMCFLRSGKMEAIGNIHDAPELLKGKGEVAE